MVFVGTADSLDRERGLSLMSDPRTSSFSAHVNEIVDLHERRAPFETVESRIDLLCLDEEEQSALWLLAFSLRNGANVHRDAAAQMGTLSYV
jgi:hypothetical protein